MVAQLDCASIGADEVTTKSPAKMDETRFKTRIRIVPSRNVEVESPFAKISTAIARPPLPSSCAVGTFAINERFVNPPRPVTPK